jgi:hypothetical protein
MLPSFRSLRPSRSLRAVEREALAPLLALAQAKGGEERRAWLDDLRDEAPTVAAAIERLLADAESPSAAAPLPGSETVPTLPHAPPLAAIPAALPVERRPAYHPPAISPGLAR